MNVPVQHARDRITIHDSGIDDNEGLPTNHNKAILTVWQVALVL
jgi:hypothetical protein